MASYSDTRPEEHGEDAELERLRAEVRQLRARMRAHPLISQAQGILRERYALPDAESAFALLQRASQQHNVKLRTLAGALLAAPRPEARAPLWFPRRVRQAEPPLTFDREGRVGRRDRGALLSAVLSQTLTVVEAGMGDVQTVDRAAGGLRMEKHIGLTPEFIDFFEHVGEGGTACALAARNVAQVTVQDVAKDPLFTEPAREAILRAGSRACHSVPLTTASGVCVGMVSAHLERPLDGLTTAQTKALDVLGVEAGEWLAWYHRTVVVDALEHLHALGRGHTGTPVRRS
ncbi:ANTAR domain-containing protein [Streptomyces sp. TP-A0356]|uniref:ANTAR domain-containing protein n=1 Tax=Streptomyces sp. TP-A0356 TaxID=1359208 RepID=UPI0006E30B62|nr:ANTAR domain-containing protein [Streptomyces sp. TP-A0356]